MKAKLVIPFMLAAVVAMLGSCVKSPDKGPDGPDTDPGTVKGLTVPAGFQWKMSRTVQCNFTASYQTMVSVAFSATAEPFASFLVGGDVEPVALSIPTASKSVYVKYEKKDGTFAGTSLNVSDASLSYAVPADSKEYVPVSGESVQAFRTASVTKAKPDKGYVNYPALGWGTLMFEDLWPSYGDYDFNDFVTNYRIELGEQNKNKFRRMQIGLHVQAIGGSLPYEFYLSLRTVKGVEIAEIKQMENTNGLFTNAMVLVNPDDKDYPALFRFQDVQTNPKAPKGVAFMNTTPGGEMKATDMVQVEYLVTFRNAIAIGQIPFDAFDFFIARADQQKEIHLAGFEPVLYGIDSYTALRTQPTSSANKMPEYYYSNDNLIWALSVPDVIPHAYESNDFLSAYPNFAKWAKSGGMQNQEWYTAAAGNRVNAKLVNMK